MFLVVDTDECQNNGMLMVAVCDVGLIDQTSLVPAVGTDADVVVAAGTAEFVYRSLCTDQRLAGPAMSRQVLSGRVT